MTTTRVTRTQLQTGDLPPVCVVTGEQADGLVQATLSSARAWPWALLLLVPLAPEWTLPVLVAVAVTLWVTTVRLPARLPITADALARHHGLRRLAGGLLAVAGAGFALAVAARLAAWSALVEPLVVGGALALVAAIAVRRTVAQRFVRAVPDRDGVHVTLRRVPDRFAEAVADQLLSSR